MFGMQLADGEIADKGRDRVVDTGDLQPISYKRRRQSRALGILVPALVGGLTALATIGVWGDALLTFLLFAAAITAFGGFSYPLRVMPATRLAVGFAGPATGGVVVGALGALGTYDIPTYSLLLPIAAGTLAAWLVDSAIIAGASRRPVRTAVVGTPAFASGLAHELSATGNRAYEVVGWLGVPAHARERSDPGPRFLGSLDDVRTAVVRDGIDLLVLGPRPDLAAFESNDVVNANGATNGSGTENRSGMVPANRAVSRNGAANGPEDLPQHLDRELEVAAPGSIQARIAADCLDLRVRMIQAGQLYEELFGHVPMGVIDDAWYLFIMHPRFHPGPPAHKRALDIAVTLLGGIVAVPLVALAAVAVKLGDRGPIFYRQQRIGEYGREFEIVKLRTMTERAEAGGEPEWSAAGDERVTRVGRVLRRLHIDELPQLYNVLRGEMTIVGPRPERPQLVAALERHYPHYERRHLVKPGMTGWAQVRCGYAGSEVGSALKLCHDLYYLKRRSLLADLAIMLETVAIAARDSHRPLRLPEDQFILGADGSPLEGRDRSPAPGLLRAESSS